MVAETFGPLSAAIKWAGVAYLCWLAWSFWTAGIAPDAVDPGDRNGDLRQSFLTGFTVALGNPKAMLFYLALTQTLIDVVEIDVSDYALLVLVTVVVILGVLLPYIGLASRARRLLRSPRALKHLNRVASVLMAVAAAAIAFRH